jgi:hypothetical protein
MFSRHAGETEKIINTSNGRQGPLPNAVAIEGTSSASVATPSEIRGPEVIEKPGFLFSQE